MNTLMTIPSFNVGNVYTKRKARQALYSLLKSTSTAKSGYLSMLRIIENIEI